MSKIDKIVTAVFVVPAAWVAVTDVWATASPQPALVNHARSGHGPTGFDQAQGRGQ